MESKGNIQKTLEQAFREKDTWKIFKILHMSHNGLLDYICNNLYSLPERDIQMFIPQLCTRILKDNTATSLERFLMDRCSSLNLAILMFFWLQAAEEDGTFAKQRCNHLWHECEMAAVNSKSRLSLRNASFLKASGTVLRATSSVINSPNLNRKDPHHIVLSSSMPMLAKYQSYETLAKSNSSEVLSSPKPPTSNSSSSNGDLIAALDLKEVPIINSSSSEALPASVVVNNPEIHVESLPFSPTRHRRAPSVGDIIESEKDSAVRANRVHVRSPSTGMIVPASPKNRSNTIKLVIPPSPARIRIEHLDADNINSKKSRHYYFQAELHFLALLSSISTTLKRHGFRTKIELNKALVSLLQQLQDSLTQENKLGAEFYANRGLYLPTSLSIDTHYRVVRILPEESFCLSSKDRVPFMLFIETIAVPLVETNAYSQFHPFSPEEPGHHLQQEQVIKAELSFGKAERVEETGLMQALEKMITYNRESKYDEVKKREKEKLEQEAKKTASEDDDWCHVNQTVSDKSPALKLAYPELWTEKEEKLRKQSPFGHDPNWRLQSVIVKSGDDLRQEQLAVQLISSFHRIFTDAELSLWLRPYSVVATSSTTGLIETIPDAISLDALKKRMPNMSSLEDYFVAVYGDKTSMPFIQAQRNFVESLAGYSIVCYLLQIKDRHNGNILLDSDGHIIHIDYGFMLSSSPGSLNFETAPFKLTHEFIQLMGGEHGDMFHYFRLMFIRGFLEVRNNWEKIVLLVEMLLPGQKMGCFARREATVRELKDRFQLGISEKECVIFVSNLIRESVGRWTTEAYDNYQWFFNGILS